MIHDKGSRLVSRTVHHFFGLGIKELHGRASGKAKGIVASAAHVVQPPAEVTDVDGKAFHRKSELFQKQLSQVIDA